MRAGEPDQPDTSDPTSDPTSSRALQRPVIPTLSPGYSWHEPDAVWPVTTEVAPGLRGVIATSTQVSWLDPSSGLLAYRGIQIEDLAGRRTFEEVAWLLISGQLPDADPEAASAFARTLRGSRRIPDEVLCLVKTLAPRTHPMRALRAATSALGCHEMSAEDELSGERHWRDMRIVGQVAALVAHLLRSRRGAARREAEPDESLATTVLAGFSDAEAGPLQHRALDLLWVLYAAHGLDAPTFASMIVASCRADPYANVVAGLSALRGLREGGAAETALEQLLALSSPAQARSWVESTLARGGRIAGFGHGLYEMPDPRVVILRKAAAELARSVDREPLFEICRAVEDQATRRLASRGVFVNINLWAAVLFHLLGARPSEIACLTAVGRMAGLVALVRESIQSLRLLRPQSRYVGPAERRLGDRAQGWPQ